MTTNHYTIHNRPSGSGLYEIRKDGATIATVLDTYVSIFAKAPELVEALRELVAIEPHYAADKARIERARALLAEIEG